MRIARAAALIAVLALGFDAPRAASAISRPGGAKKTVKTSARPADNAAVLSGGGYSITVGEGKRLLSLPMSTHLSPGVTPRAKVEATLKDALFDKLTLAALGSAGFDAEMEGETRVIRNRIVGIRFLASVVDKRLEPTAEEAAARYPRVWARARFRQITFPTPEEADAARAAALADPAFFEAAARARPEALESGEGGLTGFLDPLPFNIMMTPQMDAALFSLAAGEFSEVIETPLGYSVYQAVEIKKMSPEEVAAKKGKIAARILDEKRAIYLQGLRERIKPYNMFSDNQAQAYSLLLAYLEKGEGSAKEVVRAGDTRLSFDSVMALRTLFKTPGPGREDPVSTMGWIVALVKDSIVPDALLAQAAAEEGFRLTEADGKAVAERADRWLLDRYYDVRIGPKTRVSDNEVRSAFDGNREMFRRPRRVDYRVIEIPDGKKILEVERQMAGKGGFDAGWKWAKRKKVNAARGGGEFKETLVDDVAETIVRDALRRLTPGRRSAILSRNDRFYIVSLDGVAEWEDLAFEAVEGGIRRNLEERKRKEALAAFYEDHFPGLKLETDPATLDYLVNFFEDLREERRVKGESGPGRSPHGGHGVPGGKGGSGGQGK